MWPILPFLIEQTYNTNITNNIFTIMRKITFLLTALLLSVVASAQVTTGVYTIGVDETQKRGFIGYGYTVADQTETVYENFPVLTGITWNDHVSNSSTAKDDGNNWYIVSNPARTGYYLYNVAKRQFIEPRNDNNAYYTDTPYLWSISEQTYENVGYYNIINPKATGDYKYLSGACGTAPASKNVKIGNSATDGGSLMTLTALDGGTTTFSEQILAANQAILNAVLVPARSMADNSTGYRVGAYLAENVVALNEALSAYAEDNSEENLAAVELAYNDVKERGTKVTLGAKEKFVLKCVDTNRGYLVYSTVSGKGSETQPYLASTNKSNVHPALTDDGVYKYWAYVDNDGKKLIFNVQKKKFINTDQVVKFSDLGYAFNFHELENYLWEIKVDGENRYLSFSPGWDANAVRIEGSSDDGCKFYIDKVDESITAPFITDALEEEMRVINWKGAERPVLGYVGGYPSDAASALEAVNSLSEITTFEERDRITMADGYYFLRSATNQNKKDAYLSYNGTDCYVFTLGAGEKLSAKHVWYLKSPHDGGYKMMACNLQKYLQTANAAATSPNPTVSPITSDFENGYKYVLSSGDVLASWILTDGHGHVLRTEGDGRVNYWVSNTNATWYIIPATELDVNIGATGYATTYLPFDVTLPDDLTAYAVTETSDSEATLAAKTSIPAGQGALLKGAKNTGYKLTISKNAVTPWDANELRGTYTTENIVPNPNTTCYVLAANGSNEAGFYKATLNQEEGGNTVFQNNANKAYLPVSTAGARFLTFNFDDNAETGISAVEIEEAAPANAAIYDLSGRRVQSAKSGLYIINGKKVIK